MKEISSGSWEAGRGATSVPSWWTSNSAVKSLASTSDVSVSRAARNWHSSLLALLTSRFQAGHPARVSLYSHIITLFGCYLGCDDFVLFSVELFIRSIPFILFFTGEDFLSLKVAYLNCWALVSTVRLSRLFFFFFFVQGRGSCYCQRVLISVNKGM